MKQNDTVGGLFLFGKNEEQVTRRLEDSFCSRAGQKIVLFKENIYQYRKFQTEAAKCNFFPHNWKNNESRQRFKNKYLGPAAPQLHNSTNIYILFIKDFLMQVMLLTHRISLTNVNMILRKGYFGHYMGRGFNILCLCLCQWGLMVMIRLGHDQCRH